MEEVEDNQEIYEPMICKNDEHDDQQYIVFKFSENINKILQCLSCCIEDNKNNNKIEIDQLMKFPVTKINNFPPMENPNKSIEFRKALEICSQENLKLFREKIMSLIEGHYQKVNQDLNNFLLQSKKSAIQYFENFLEFPDISGFYDIEPLKEALDQYQKKDINLQELFDIQLKMKKEYECEKKSQIVLNMVKKQKEIENQIQNLRKNLDDRAQIFKQDIKINNGQIQKFQNQIIKMQDNKNILQYQKLNNIIIQKQADQIQFYESNYYNNDKQNIEIENNNKSINFFESKQGLKFVYTESLDKNKSYHFRIKINLNIQNSNQLYFYLIGSNHKDNDWDDQNYISFRNQQVYSGTRNGNQNVRNNQRFINFWKNDKNILNVVFNYSQQTFMIYDDEEKCIVKSTITQVKIDGELMMGIKGQNQLSNYGYDDNNMHIQILNVQIQ